MDGKDSDGVKLFKEQCEIFQAILRAIGQYQAQQYAAVQTEIRHQDELQAKLFASQKRKQEAAREAGLAKRKAELAAKVSAALQSDRAKLEANLVAQEADSVVKEAEFASRKAVVAAEAAVIVAEEAEFASKQADLAAQRVNEAEKIISDMISRIKMKMKEATLALDKIYPTGLLDMADGRQEHSSPSASGTLGAQSPVAMQQPTTVWQHPATVIVFLTNCPSPANRM